MGYFVMASRLAGRLETFFREKTGGNLRSIITYEMDDREFTYLRDDIADQYSTDELEKAVDDSRMESLSAPMYQDIYSEEHGDLSCLVKCFENVVEMNFVLDDGVGAVVALDIGALDGSYGLVSEAREIVEAERE